MNIRRQFVYDPSIDIIASQIGVSKWTWTYIDHEDINEAKSIMLKNRFDVLPVINMEGNAVKYFATLEWSNYESIELFEIDDLNSIYYRTSIKDLVRKFINDHKHYYFLTDGYETLGLVSYINLNCQFVYNYLYNVLADIERKISEILKKHISQEQIINQFEKSKDKFIHKILKDFNDIKNDNEDNNIFQHIYLQTIGVI